MGLLPLSSPSPHPGLPGGHIAPAAGTLWDSPGYVPDVKVGLAPGVHEDQQSPLEVREASHIVFHKVHLVLEQQQYAHLQGSTGSGPRPGPQTHLPLRVQEPEGPEGDFCNLPHAEAKLVSEVLKEMAWRTHLSPCLVPVTLHKHSCTHELCP